MALLKLNPAAASITLMLSPEVAAETVVCFEMSDYRLYPGLFAEWLVFLPFHVVGVARLWPIGYHYLGGARLFLPPVAPVAGKQFRPLPGKPLHLLKRPVYRVSVVLVAEGHLPDNTKLAIGLYLHDISYVVFDFQTTDLGLFQFGLH